MIAGQLLDVVYMSELWDGACCVVSWLVVLIYIYNTHRERERERERERKREN